MTFHSILFERIEDVGKEEINEAPAFFVDLNLDQVIDAITANKQEYNLKPFFYSPLSTIDAIAYRHEIMKDLEDQVLFKNINTFAQSMRRMREHLTQEKKFYYKNQKESCFVDAVEIYCDAVNCLVDELSLAELKSRGFLAFRDFLRGYAKSNEFLRLCSETKSLKADLSTVKYSLLIRGSAVTVRKYESEIDYSIEVEKTFEKFKQGAVKDYRTKFKDWIEMNHVEAEIIALVARLFPDIFLNLDRFYVENRGYLDETIGVFDREIQFYISYLEYAEKIKQAGLKFCYPVITNQSKEVFNYDGFDLALAEKLVTEGSSIVCNDFFLKEKERILVVSGPNQGGKTTFARTFGQLHYLGSIGVPVPGRKAKLFLPDRIFTHFEREENIINHRGKLEDDLIRVYEILNQATSSSIIIMNEIFTSTTLNDAIFLSNKILQRIIQLDLLCVCVTFIDELTSLEKTVSMVSTVVPENPELRTFKILRKQADGLAYAISIAEKYHLTYDQLQERLQL